MTEHDRKHTLCELAGGHDPGAGVGGRFVEGMYIWCWECEHCGMRMRSHWRDGRGWQTREVGRDGE